MSDRDAYLLSPYRPPTTYPGSVSTDEAATWLSGYLALWHPSIVRLISRPPTIDSSYEHDQPHDRAIYVVPEGPHLYQPDDWPDRLKEAEAVSSTATADRDQTLADLLAQLSNDQAGTEVEIAADLLRSFQGVGYGHLLIETLFEAMEHEHLLDADGFWHDLKQAAEEAVKGQDGREAAFGHLRAAAEKLRIAREALNSNTIYLLDWLIPDPNLGEWVWPGSLHQGLPVTLLASGETLSTLQEKAPERFAELRKPEDAGLPSNLAVVSGAFREREDTLLPAESQWWNMLHGRKAVKTLLGHDVEVYGRYRTALHAHLPGWLLHAGYKSAVMVNFDGALTPARNTVVVNWPGPDGKAVDAYAREPLPAADPQTFFNLSYHIYQAMTQDSTPTIALQHRGKPAAVGYDDLLSLTHLAEVVGSFNSVDKFLAEYHYGEYLGALTADDFFADYLDDRVTRLSRPDPVSGFARLTRRRRKLDGAFAMAALHRMLTPPTEDDLNATAELEDLERQIELAGADVGPTADGPLPLDTALSQAEQKWTARLAERVQSRSQPGTPGLLVFNPCGFARRVGLELEPFPSPIPVESPVKAAQFDADATRLVVEVPGLGFAWIPRPTEPAAGVTASKPRIRAAEGTTVRNEFFEAELDPKTGALRAFRDTRTRINRLGMQLVYNPGSEMRATEVKVTQVGSALGEVTATGELIDKQQEVIARYKLVIRAWVGRPALELGIKIEPVKAPSGYPWHSFYGAHFVWRDERAALFRGDQGSNSQSHYTRPCSADYLEIRLGGERTFLFTGGLPFIQRNGGRMADLILIPEGEQAQEFDLLLACDRDYPMATATGWNAPAPVVSTDRGPPPVGNSGWLGHLDLPSLLMTSLRPVPPEELGEPSNGEAKAERGVYARFIETAGFGGMADFQFARNPTRSTTVDAFGQPGYNLTMHDGIIPLEFSANEAFRVRAEWAAPQSPPPANPDEPPQNPETDS